MSELIWTGDLNNPYRINGHVGLYDTTLRDGEQTVGVVLGPQEKLEIARLLDDVGIDRIEAGFPRVSADDYEAVRLISEAGLRAEVWGFSRAVPADTATPGSSSASRSRISATGSTASTSAPVSASSRVNLPVPAPRSTTVRPA